MNEFSVGMESWRVGVVEWWRGGGVDGWMGGVVEARLGRLPATSSIAFDACQNVQFESVLLKRRRVD
jgi:hypothetical protein